MSKPVKDNNSLVRLDYRIATGVFVGALITLFSWYGLSTSHKGAADFGWAIREAALMVRGQNPYSAAVGFDSVPYPLTAAIFGLPFCWLDPAVAGALFIGISSGLLSFAVTRQGWNRLLIFASYPFWAAVFTVQWSPLLTAAALLPWLYPVVIAKPNIGIPVAIRAIGRNGVLAAVALALITVAIRPDWPLTWWRQTRGYQSFIPIVSGAGMLLVVLLRWVRRDADCRFLLLMGVMPQRWYYDALLLWLLPASTVELVVAGVLSWGAMVATAPVRTIHQVALISTAFNYLPMLGILLFRKMRPALRERFQNKVGGL